MTPSAPSTVRQRLGAAWRGRGRSILRAAGWPVIAALFTVAVVLGWIGFDQNLAALNQPGSFLDKLYLSLQLFVLQSGAVAPPVPWQLEVARYLAPAATAYATVSAVVAVLDERIAAIRSRRAADHVVVCGLGRLGVLVAKGLHGAGHAVVAIEADPQNAAIGACRAAGILVLVGDATDIALLRTARVDRARYLVVVTGDDGTNAKIAIDARRLVEGRTGPPLTCFVHLLDGNLVGLMRHVAIAQPGDPTFRLEVFNAAERGVPALLRAHPAFDEDATTPFGRPHLLVVGLGEMGSRLVVDAARRWRSLPAAAGRRLKVTAVDNRADQHVAALLERYPRLREVCDLVAHQVELDSAAFERAGFLFDERGACTITSVYICVGDDAVGLSAALQVRRRLADRRVPIVVRTTQEGGVAAFLGGGVDPEADAGLSVFGLLDLVCRPEILLTGQNEVLARAIHDDYVRHIRAAMRWKGNRRRSPGSSCRRRSGSRTADRLPTSAESCGRSAATSSRWPTGTHRR